MQCGIRSLNYSKTGKRFSIHETEYLSHITVLHQEIVLICSPQHDLIVDLGGIKGRIPRCEGALGIEEGWTRDIALIARVNKPVCFLITGFENSAEGPVALLSRRAVQQKALACLTGSLRPGDIIDAVVTHLEPFGAFVDIGPAKQTVFLKASKNRQPSKSVGGFCFILIQRHLYRVDNTFPFGRSVRRGSHAR